MPRSDGRLLAYLITRHRPESKDAVHRALEESAPEALSVSAVGQLLIRAKLISPREFVACRALIDAAHRMCEACDRPFVALAGAAPKRRRCECGHVNTVPAMTGASPLDDSRSRGRSTGRARATTRTQDAARGTGRRKHTGHTSNDRPAVHESSLPSSEAPSLATGVPKRVGRYAILEKIGDGGMGLIYRAKEPLTGRIVALKLLRKGVSRDAETRFQREAQAIARLHHPAIIKVHDVGRDDLLDAPFFTMDLIEGRELTEIRHELEQSELIELLAVIADGLHHGHEQGIVHRDIKPQNILIDSRGDPKITDFGLARDLAASSLTQDGDLVGTPLFMAPEQLRGDTDGIDRRTDVYALGVLIYYTLTDTLPIEAGSLIQLQQRIQSVRPTPPSQLTPAVSPVLDAIVLKALEKCSDDRYQTTKELAEDLRRFLAGESVDVQPVGSAVRYSRQAWSAVTSAWGMALAGVVILLGILTGFGVHLHRKSVAEEAQRQALEGRRAACLGTLAEARAAFVKARQLLADGQRAVAMKNAERASSLATRASRDATALGAQAPSNALSEATAILAGAQIVRARALAAGGPEEREEAAPLFERLVQRNPEDLTLKLERGRLELNAGHVAVSARLFKDVLAQDGARPDAYYYRAETNRLLGKLQFAKFDYERALQDRARLGYVTPARVLVGRAMTLLALEDLPGARRDLEEAQTLSPQDPKVRLLRAAFLQARGEGDEALRELDLASRSFEDDAELRLASGLAWSAAGVPRIAQQELEAALALDHSSRMWLARGRLRALTGDTEAALADLQQALKRARPEDPVRPEVLLAQARTLRGVGRSEEALRALSELVPSGRLELGGVPFALEQAELRIASGALTKAGRGLQRVLEVAPKSVRALRSQVWIAALQDDTALVTAHVTHLLEVAPRDPVGLALGAGAYRAKGDEARAADLLARARRAQEQLQATEPGLWIPVGEPLREALAALEQGRRDAARARGLEDGPRDIALTRAEGALLRALSLAPWWTPAQVSYAELLAERGRTPQALAALEKALARAPVSAQGGQQLALLLASEGRHQEAVTTFRQALADMKGDSPATRQRRGELLLARARSLRALGQIPQALADLDEAVRVQPKLLEGYRLRSRLRSASGDAVGADADQQKVHMLEEGYVRIYEEARREAWRLSHEGDHITALSTLKPAFALVSRERDPSRAAELYLVRAYMALRCVRLVDALIDHAAMLDLTPNAFQQVHEELLTLRAGDGLRVDMEKVLEKVDAQRTRQDEVDPDFLNGFVAVTWLELLGSVPEPRLRAGERALARVLDRRPAHASALLLRAILLLELGDTTEALRCAVTAQEGRKAPLAYASYQLARIQSVQGDLARALRSLDDALGEGYHVYRWIEVDPALENLRADPRFAITIRLSQGSGYLMTLERAETLLRQRSGAAREELLRVSLTSATTGLAFLKELLTEQQPKALELAARLYLARAKHAARLKRPAEARRDLAAAVEADPRVLLDWEQMAEAATAVAPLTPKNFKSARPLPGAPFPTRFRIAVPTLLKLLSGEPVDALELRSAIGYIERTKQARHHVLLSPLRLAQGDSGAALSTAEAAPVALTALGAWFAARAHAAQGRPGLALDTLRAARASGLRGSMLSDKAFESMADDPRFRQLFPRMSLPDHKKWRLR